MRNDVLKYIFSQMMNIYIQYSFRLRRQKHPLLRPFSVVVRPKKRARRMSIPSNNFVLLGETVPRQLCFSRWLQFYLWSNSRFRKQLVK